MHFIDLLSDTFISIIGIKFNYLGCYKDATIRDLTVYERQDRLMTINLCTELCSLNVSIDLLKKCIAIIFVSLL